MLILVYPDERPGEASGQGISGFLQQLNKAVPAGSGLHVIPDNSGTINSGSGAMAHSPSPGSLAPDANQRAWLDAVAGWCGQVERRASHGGIFTTVQDLWDEMQRFIR